MAAKKKVAKKKVAKKRVAKKHSWSDSLGTKCHTVRRTPKAATRTTNTGPRVAGEGREPDEE